MAFGQTLGSSESGIKKVFATALTETPDKDLEGVGAIRFEGGKVYKWVKYSSGAGPVTAVAGKPVVYVADTGYGANVVTMDFSDGGTNRIGAGILQAVIPNNSFGWIQIKGFAALASGGVSGTTDGKTLTCDGAADGVLDDAATLEQRVGLAVDASADEIVCDFPF